MPLSRCTTSGQRPPWLWADTAHRTHGVFQGQRCEGAQCPTPRATAQHLLFASSTGGGRSVWSHTDSGVRTARMARGKWTSKSARKGKGGTGGTVRGRGCGHRHASFPLFDSGPYATGGSTGGGGSHSPDVLCPFPGSCSSAGQYWPLAPQDHSQCKTQSEGHRPCPAEATPGALALPEAGRGSDPATRHAAACPVRQADSKAPGPLRSEVFSSGP